MPRHILILPVPAEPRHPRQNNPLVNRLQHIRAEAELLEDTRPERIDDDIRVLDEGLDEVDARALLEVDGDGGFVAGEGVARRGGELVPVRGAGDGAVDAQDGGAVVGEQEAGEGTCVGVSIWSRRFQ
jgi:hypothetical protein